MKARLSYSVTDTHLNCQVPGKGATCCITVGTTNSVLDTDPRHRARNDVVIDLNPEGKLPAAAD